MNQILPFVRLYVVKKLYNNKGFSQKEIAEKLNISQPLVSMYLNEKRGKTSLDLDLKRRVKEVVKDMDFSNFKICSICKKYKNDLPGQQRGQQGLYVPSS